MARRKGAADAGPKNEWGYDAAEWDSAMAEVRRRLSAELPQLPMYDDFFVGRFLRARKLQVDPTVEMLRKCIAWRKENGVDSLLDHPPDPKVAAFARYWPCGIYGTSRDGHRVYYQRIGRGRVHHVLGSYYSVEEAVAYEIRSSEISNSGDMPPRLRTYYVVIDVGGLEVAMATAAVRDWQSRLGKVMEANQPETLEKIFIINAGRAFAALWSFAQYFYAEEVRAKIKVLAGRSQYWPVLTKYIDPAQLPSFVEGGLADVGEEWAGDLRYMETLPLHQSHEGLHHRVSVPHGKDVAITVHVPPGGALKWTVLIEKHDIPFSITHEDGTVVVRERHMQHPNTQISGTLHNLPGGEYRLNLLNHRARWHTKHVRYALRAVDKGEPIDQELDELTAAMSPTRQPTSLRRPDVGGSGA
eukprot:TRINITY_DN12338_c0_g1_i1.p1 TRINITY_DN12338_c0_g1~~TRINITY_DN12338_c0_g1_i1.p1  ORF type:complete len:414 (+),score=106.79 TRINITY_DN12338_c0_g1_i1:99-1340(+)